MRAVTFTLSLAILAVLEGIAYAGTVTATWVNPTSYVDGTALVAADISRTRVEYGTCSGTAFGTRIGDIIATGATTSVTATLPAGTYCFRAFTTAKGVESASSNLITKVVPQPAPSPPTLTVIDAVAYSVTTDWPNLAFVKSKAVGTVPLGTVCSDAKTDDGYNMVPTNLVKWTGGKSTYVVAKCG